MRKADLVVASICFAVAAVTIQQSVPHYFGDRGGMGSGAYPTYLGVLLAACGLSILVQWLRGNRETGGKPFFPTGSGGKKLAYSSAALVIHRVATDFLGFSVASLLLMIFQMRTLGKYNWRTTLALSVVFVAAVGYTFRQWLYMALPRGFLGF